jgi:hypothetical protein
LLDHLQRVLEAVDQVAGALIFPDPAALVLEKLGERPQLGVAVNLDDSPAITARVLERAGVELVRSRLTIARADGEVNTEETAVLRDISAELSSGFEIDFETLLFEHVNASDLAEALSKASGGPFRGPSASAPAEIAAAFIEAARSDQSLAGSVGSSAKAACSRPRSAASSSASASP